MERFPLPSLFFSPVEMSTLSIDKAVLGSVSFSHLETIIWTTAKLDLVYPLSSNSDQDNNSFYIITTCSNVQVRRIKEVITKEETFWNLDKFSSLVP